MNVKKTKNSKKIVLKIAMSMTPDFVASMDYLFFSFSINTRFSSRDPLSTCVVGNQPACPYGCQLGWKYELKKFKKSCIRVPATKFSVFLTKQSGRGSCSSVQCVNPAHGHPLIANIPDEQI